MNAKEIIKGLKKEFPGRPILALPPDNPKEIICELGKTANESTAIAYIDQSVPHYHVKTKEHYIVEKGSLVVNEAGLEHELKEGEEHTIYPPVIHSAKGNATRVRVVSSPPWSQDDHVLAM